jgi:predicted N-acetyltransferase YhbS
LEGVTGGPDQSNAITAPVPLAPEHELDSFDSGVIPLDDWLKRRARRNELAAGSVLHADAAGRIRRNMPDPVPVVLLGRLAVDRGWQRKGLGSDLLSDAVLRVVGAARTVGVRALLVHAISDGAKSFYETHGFRSSPLDPMALMITIAEAEKMLRQLGLSR